MPTQDWQIDTLATVLDGQDFGIDPELIGAANFQYGRNLSIRGGRVHSRPPILPVATLNPGLIQGATYFSKPNGTIIVSIAGRVYQIDPTQGFTITRLTVEDPTGLDPSAYNNPNLPYHWYCETPSALVIQDNQGIPIIYNGTTYLRSVLLPGALTNQVPVGSVMNFSNGRLAVAVGNTMVQIGDIIQGDVAGSELIFTETYALNGGGNFSFSDIVTALNSLPIIDTASGQGALIVGCGGRVYSLRTNVTTRTLWSTIGFQTEVFMDVGISGARTVASVNQDLYYRASDGIRSYRTTYDTYQSPGLTTISKEIRNRTDFDSPGLLQYGAGAFFDNRYFFTHSPVVYGNRSIALGLATLNFDMLNSRGQKSPPSYEGDWDGIQIAELVTGYFLGLKRCFAIGMDLNGNNGIWEIQREIDEPIGTLDTPGYEIVTRSFAGGSKISNGTVIGCLDDLKALQRCSIWMSNILDPIEGVFWFRPDKYPYWIQWDTFSINTQAATTPWVRQMPLTQGPISTHTPPDSIEAVSTRSLNKGFSFQVRVTWTGRARLDYLQCWTKRQQTQNIADNDTEGSTVLYSGVPEGQVAPEFWYGYNAPPQPYVNPVTPPYIAYP